MKTNVKRSKSKHTLKNQLRLFVYISTSTGCGGLDSSLAAASVRQEAVHKNET